MQNARSVTRLVTSHRQREGGGFVVRRPFPTSGFPFADPFLMLDEMGPVEYGPGEAVGAPDHPHRGFETVTYVLDGEVEHEDSAGHRGVIGPGDVQWMTAGRGVIHSEEPSRALRERGGRMHGFQLWVNLPRQDKMMPPRYQEIPSARIPTAKTEDGRVAVKVIAGEALGVHAVIETRTPIAYQDWTVEPGGHHTVALDAALAAYVYVFGGTLRVAERDVADGQLAILGAGDSVAFAVPEGAKERARFLLLGGAPLREPVVQYGPFVMNTEEEIAQAIDDYRSGKMGAITR